MHTNFTWDKKSQSNTSGHGWLKHQSTKYSSIKFSLRYVFPKWSGYRCNRLFLTSLPREFVIRDINHFWQVARIIIFRNNDYKSITMCTARNSTINEKLSIDWKIPSFDTFLKALNYPKIMWRKLFRFYKVWTGLLILRKKINLNVNA